MSCEVVVLTLCQYDNSTIRQLVNLHKKSASSNLTQSTLYLFSVYANKNLSVNFSSFSDTNNRYDTHH